MTTYTQTEQATSRVGWKLWLSQGRRNRDTGLILPRVLFFLFGCEKAPPSSEKSRKQGCFYTLFRSIFDRFKKPEGRFLLLELGRFISSLNKFV